MGFNEREAVSLLNWLARHNQRELLRNPDFPGLYASNVVYQREEVETWCDYAEMLVQGWEDCDGLSAARAGELLARGWRALSPGEEGYREARASRITSIPAEVMMTTNVPAGGHGLYHCIVRYRVNGRRCYDDPSARLGMLPTLLSAEQTAQRIRSRVLFPKEVA